MVVNGLIITIPLIISVLVFLVYWLLPNRGDEVDLDEENAGIMRAIFIMFVLAGGFAFISRQYGTDLGETLTIIVAMIGRLF